MGAVAFDTFIRKGISFIIDYPYEVYFDHYRYRDSVRLLVFGTVPPENFTGILINEDIANKKVMDLSAIKAASCKKNVLENVNKIQFF